MILNRVRNNRVPGAKCSQLSVQAPFSFKKNRILLQRLSGRGSPQPPNCRTLTIGHVRFPAPSSFDREGQNQHRDERRKQERQRLCGARNHNRRRLTSSNSVSFFTKPKIGLPLHFSCWALVFTWRTAHSCTVRMHNSFYLPCLQRTLDVYWQDHAPELRFRVADHFCTPGAWDGLATCAERMTAAFRINCSGLTVSSKMEPSLVVAHS